MKKSCSQPKPPFNLRIKLPLIGAWVLFSVALAAAAGVTGYVLAWQKVSGVYAETVVLKAKAVEMENELQRLRNYAVLIDAITTQGQAANDLARMPVSQPAPKSEDPEKIILGGGDE